MRNLKSFDDWGILDTDDLDTYRTMVAHEILTRMEKAINGELSPMVVGKNAITYILDMIGGYTNSDGEYVTNYPEYFQDSVDTLYEAEYEIDECADYFIDGCLEMYYGHRSAL